MLVRASIANTIYSDWRPGLSPRPVCVGLALEEALGQGFL
jgi:hypothetical protein